MKKVSQKKQTFEHRPNMVNYVEEDERGLHFHYSANRPWTLYLGDSILYRKEPKMMVIEQAWERDFDALLDLRIHLDTYLISGDQKEFSLKIKDGFVQLTYHEVAFLRDEIEGVVRKMKHEQNQWVLRPVGQRVPPEHQYAVI